MDRRQLGMRRTAGRIAPVVRCARNVRADQVLWEVELGDHQYTIPRVEGDRIFIGVNDTNLDHPAARSTGGGILMCLDRATGSGSGSCRFRVTCPARLRRSTLIIGSAASARSRPWTASGCLSSGRAATCCASIPKDRRTETTARSSTRNRTSASPPNSDYQLTPTDGDIVWRFDMIEQLGVIPHDVCGSSPAVLGDFVYACTSNGVDDTHLRIPNPQAPSLIALDKHTGRLAATDGAISGDRILHGTWSSPVVAELADRVVGALRWRRRCAAMRSNRWKIHRAEGPAPDAGSRLEVRLLSGRLPRARRTADSVRALEQEQPGRTERDHLDSDRPQRARLCGDRPEPDSRTGTGVSVVHRCRNGNQDLGIAAGGSHDHRRRDPRRTALHRRLFRHYCTAWTPTRASTTGSTN